MAIVQQGFAAQARAVARGLGVPGLAVVEYPGMLVNDSPALIGERTREVLAPAIPLSLAADAIRPEIAREPAPREVVFRGTLEEVQGYFHGRHWTDGLPVIPPTLERVEEFMRCISRRPDEVLGVLPPEHREATIWSVAVNGVMAGCRPEYMPVLVACVEAICHPLFRLQDAGSTPGWEPLIILNGPIAQALDFHSGQGALRVGRQANTSLGRFLRLYMRNIAGLRVHPDGLDKASIGATFNVALAEDDQAVKHLGWETLAMQRGFSADDSVATVESVVSVSPPIYVAGATPQDVVQTIAEAWAQGDCAYWSCLAMEHGDWHCLLVITPGVAAMLARDGWTKGDVSRYLYEHAFVSTEKVESYAHQIGLTHFSLARKVQEGSLPPEYGTSDSPGHMVRVFARPEWIQVVVAGDPDRNQVRGYVGNHRQGAPVTRLIETPGTPPEHQEEAAPRGRSPERGPPE